MICCLLAAIATIAANFVYIESHMIENMLFIVHVATTASIFAYLILSKLVLNEFYFSYTYGSLLLTIARTLTGHHFLPSLGVLFVYVQYVCVCLFN